MSGPFGCIIGSQARSTVHDGRDGTKQGIIRMHYFNKCRGDAKRWGCITNIDLEDRLLLLPICVVHHVGENKGRGGRGV